jgi:Mg-chelatase subunit ChlI
VFDGAGQWRNPQTGRVVRQPTKILVVASELPRPDLKDRLTAVIDAYRSRFQQQSVGVITRTACAGF